jgi:hypothetical protein
MLNHNLKILTIAATLGLGCSQSKKPSPSKKDNADSTGVQYSSIIMDHEDPSFLIYKGTRSRPKLADRYLVAESLEYIFGPGATQITKDYIRGKGTTFGGPCDSKGTYQKDDCTSPTSENSTHASVNPSSVSLREGWRHQACEQIVIKDANVHYAVSQVLKLSPDASPTRDDIAAIYKLFYSGRIPTDDEVLSLVAIIDAAAITNYPKIDLWRLPLLTLCLSSGWQVL